MGWVILKETHKRLLLSHLSCFLRNFNGMGNCSWYNLEQKKKRKEKLQILIILKITYMCIHTHMYLKVSEVNQIVAGEDKQSGDEKVSLWPERDLVQILLLILSSHMTLSKIISLCQFPHL